MHAVWPHAKHQLCFWHALRALKQYLSKTKDAPGSYNVEEAQWEFSYISSDFLPITQCATGSLVTAFNI